MHGTSDIAALRAHLQAAEAFCPRSVRRLSLGSAAADRELGEKLVCGRVHEAGGPAATLFAGLVLALSEGPVLWCAAERSAGALYPPGLAQAGLNPARLVLVRLWSRDDLLHAAHEGLRAGWQVVLEAAKPLGLNASRRLQLAAEAGGGLGLVLGEASPGEGLAPSALTRWRVLFGGAAVWPGPARLDVRLLRYRGGRPGQWIVEWDHASRTVSVVSPACHRSRRAQGAALA